jgi:hypothetical protein
MLSVSVSNHYKLYPYLCARQVSILAFVRQFKHFSRRDINEPDYQTFFQVMLFRCVLNFWQHRTRDIDHMGIVDMPNEYLVDVIEFLELFPCSLLKVTY